MVSSILPNMSTYRPALLLLSVFVLACVLRMYHLGTLPYGLHEDEMMNGYVGRFILLNGKDLYGNRWPVLYFNNFGDYPPVIPMYLSGLGTFLFGVTPFAVRFPIAFFGSLAVFPMYFVAKRIFSKERYALAAAFFLAISPWHIMLSRATAENVTATCFLLGALFFLLRFNSTRRLLDLAFAIMITLAKYFLYASFRVTTPLAFFAAIFLSKDKKWRILMLSLTIIFSLSTLAIGRTEWGRGRFKQTSIFYFNNAINNRIANMEIEEGSGHILTTRVFHNKLVVVSREFIRQYFSYFSPNFLFTDGGLPHRYIMEDQGLLYISFLGMIGVAILVAVLHHGFRSHDIFTKEGRKLFGYLLFVLAVSPIPSALTLDDTPNVHRAAMVGVMLIFPITYAFACCEYIKWKKYGIQLLLLMTLTVEVVYFWHQFSVHTTAVQSMYRGDDRTTLAKYLVEHHNEYDHVYLPHDAKPLFYLFESNNFDSALAGQFGPNISLDHVDNLNFTASNCASDTAGIALTKDSLLVNRENCVTSYGLKKVGQILRGDNTGSFILVQPLDSVAPAISQRDKKKKNV